MTLSFISKDAFDSNQLRDTNIDKVTNAARKVCFQLGFGGEPLFYDVDELLANADVDEYPCKFDVRGNVIPGREEEPDFYEADSANNPRHNFPQRIEPALEALRRHREEEAERMRRQEALEIGNDSSDDNGWYNDRIRLIN